MMSIVLVGDRAVHRIEAAAREPIDVALEEPSTSGYVWQAAKTGDVSVVDAGIVAHGAPGMASVHHFTVTVTKPGQVTVEFTLRRPWEGSAPPGDAASLTIDAR